MAEVKFVLKEPNSTRETLVYLFYNFHNQRLKYSTGEKINPKYWNTKKQRAKEVRDFPEYPEFNVRLNNIEATVNNVYRKLVNDGHMVTVDLLRSGINILLSGHKPVAEITFPMFIKTYIETVKNIKRPATISIYNTTLTHLEGYHSSKKKGINFKDITLDFYQNFIEYLSVEKGYKKNTVGKYIRILKVFLNEATERGINQNVDFKSKKFATLQEETDKVYLNEDELTALAKLDLSETKRLEKARDTFLIGCSTGLRFSDLSSLLPENFDFENRKLKIKTIKTGQTIVIPLKPLIIEILQKYNGSLPPIISNQKMNKYIKEVCKKVDTLSNIEKTVKNVEGSQITIRKFDLISTHTARRSFATNAYLAGVPTISIMKITGHRTEKAFMRYIRISQDENATLMLNHPFFN
jgi:integrase